MNKEELVEQTKLGFDLLQKLYLETSYLVKEIEGLLVEEDERFVIGKPSGYGISSRGSAGLEPNNVPLWLLRRFAFFFVPEDVTQRRGSQTHTDFESDPRVIYMRIILDDKDLEEPVIYHGVMYDFICKSEAGKWPTKFEQLMTHFEYRADKALRLLGTMDYEDSHVQFKANLLRTNLFEIGNSTQIVQRVVNPTLKLFRDTHEVP